MRLFWMQYSRRILTINLILVVVCLGSLGIWYVARTPLTAAVDSVPVLGGSPVSVSAHAWDSVTLSQRESEIAAALQCARADDSRPLEINPILEAESHQMIDSLATVTDTDQLFASYDWVLVAPMWFDGLSPSGCGWSDFNPATMDIDRIQHIGIALKPPVDYTPASVLILGKEAP